MWDEVLNQINQNTTPQKAIAYWHGNKNSIELISSGINLVYRFVQGKQTCYLRLTHADLKPLTELKAALIFQQHLQLHHVPVCPLIASDNARLIEPVEQGEHLFLAHVVAEVPGIPMHFNYEQPALYQHWGRALGMFHLASQSFASNKHHYGRWENEVAELDGYAKPKNAVIESELYDAFNEKRATQIINQAKTICQKTMQRLGWI